MEDGLVQLVMPLKQFMHVVLILVVVEDGLVHVRCFSNNEGRQCLNPCCSGRWSRTSGLDTREISQEGLNPCCSGRWSRTEDNAFDRSEYIMS